jgi:flagellar biosynthesis component FlhA
LDKEDKEKQTRFVKDIIVNAYSTEKINELYYTLLREKISKYE